MNRSVAGILGVLLMQCAACTQPPETQRHAFFALGTLVEISVYDPPPDIDATLRAVEVELLEQEQLWRAWDDGELATINRRLAAGEAVALSPEMAAGIEQANMIATRSRGHFNPAIGKLVETWGFHTEERSALPPPSSEQVNALLPSPQLSALQQHDDGAWTTSDPRLWIDMGAFAKGLAVEVAVGILRDNGIENAIVNAGGDLKAIGQPGERHWRIGVRHPRGQGVLAALEARPGESLFTSGNYERFFEWSDTRYHHILDPATGAPARGVTSVTVIHVDAALADAAATALFVAGKDDWAATARAMSIDIAMLVLENGDVELTPKMQQRVAFETEPENISVRTP